MGVDGFERLFQSLCAAFRRRRQRKDAWRMWAQDLEREYERGQSGEAQGHAAVVRVRARRLMHCDRTDRSGE
jgi:hypothetical protein